MRITCASLYAMSDDGRVTSPHRSASLQQLSAIQLVQLLVSERRSCRRYASVRADQDIAQVDEQQAL